MVLRILWLLWNSGDCWVYFSPSSPIRDAALYTSLLFVKVSLETENYGHVSPTSPLPTFPQFPGFCVHTFEEVFTVTQKKQS